MEFWQQIRNTSVMSKSAWNTDNIPNQQGRVVIVTGATSGLGKSAAKILTAKGATVVMAVRNTVKGEEVLNEIASGMPNHSTSVMKLDLSSLKSVKDFSEEFMSRFDRLDVLINNAGIMFCPYSKTEDGLEIQMGTNHFGHFALTGRLMPVLKATSNARIVVTSSIGHQMGNIDVDDINWESRSYKTRSAYGDSKLANLYFAYEFARMFSNDDEAPRMTVAHPGWTSTELQRHSGLMRFLNLLFSQEPDMGVLPTLRAAFDEDAKAGDYFGPSGWMEFKGNPKKVQSNKLSHNRDVARKVWEISEELTGIKF